MARAALVVCVIAAAAAPIGAARGATDAMTSGSSYVVRGVVVQYIPPSGTVVGSLSIRVLSTSAQGRALLGELVTVPVARAKALSAKSLRPQKSRCTITLSARSTGSILKGAAVVKTIVPGSPASGSPAAGTAQPGSSGQAPTVDPDTTSPGNVNAAGSGNKGSAQPADHGAAKGGGDDSGQQGNDGSGQGNGASAHGNGGSAKDGNPGSQGHGGGGNSSAHK